MVGKIFYIIILAGLLCSVRANAQMNDAIKKSFVEHYHQLELRKYTDSYKAAVELQQSIESFLKSPTEDNLSKAKSSWLKARANFEETKVDRSFQGPIALYSQDIQERLQRRINPWPLNDAAIDYVRKDLHAGMINDPQVILNKEVLIKKSSVEEELGGVTGYPAIEFLLWGQVLKKSEKKGSIQRDYEAIGDLKKNFLLWGQAFNSQELAKVPPHSFFETGRRLALDYAPGNVIKDRRRLYLKIVADLLVEDLKAVVDSLKLIINGKDDLQRILFGLANASNYELATKNIYAVIFYDGHIYTQSMISGTAQQEFQYDIIGMIEAYHTGLDQLALVTDPHLAGRIEAQLKESNKEARVLAYDQDVETKEIIMVRLMRSLYWQGELFKQLARNLGISIHLEREEVKSDGKDPKEAFSGGDTTTFDDSDLAFLRPASNSSYAHLKAFYSGYNTISINWLMPSSSIKEFSGLGPIYNRISCSACHINGGPGLSANNEKEPMGSVIIRLSVPGARVPGGLRAHPIYGYQLRDHAVTGVLPEARVTVNYHEVQGFYPDGQTYSLRVPEYKFVDLHFGPLGDDVLFSPRVAPSLFGLGLLESVDEKTILSLANAEKHFPGRVGGKPNYVWDEERKSTVLGRFGWKANQPSIEQQIALAFIEDIGITNPIYPQHDIPYRKMQGLTPAESNIPQRLLDRLSAYLHLLAVPARRDLSDPQVIHGEGIFKKIGCAACHIDTMQTGENKEIPELSKQTIHPYTDLLLHDMGSGLADGRPDFLATGREWRTAPLWGIGLVGKINKNASFLHDGRARSLEEAVLWHGGQASIAQKRFKALSKQERQELLSFLKSL